MPTTTPAIRTSAPPDTRPQKRAGRPAGRVGVPRAVRGRGRSSGSGGGAGAGCARRAGGRPSLAVLAGGAGGASSPGTRKEAPHRGHLTAFPGGSGLDVFRTAAQDGQVSLVTDMAGRFLAKGGEWLPQAGAGRG